MGRTDTFYYLFKSRSDNVLPANMQPAPGVIIDGVGIIDAKVAPHARQSIGAIPNAPRL